MDTPVQTPETAPLGLGNCPGCDVSVGHLENLVWSEVGIGSGGFFIPSPPA
ncbi:hypothetical protein ABIE13_003738 [Ottowia thiooxydans]|uniref:Uncharacterized protein n=1 Tax=Ottowia thiooxydans TaxID=219182 RepID=A0ABV2QDJ1_9BURK